MSDTTPYKPPSSKNRRLKFAVAGVFLLVLAIIGIVVGIVVSKNKNKTNAASSGNNSGGTSDNDPRLKKVFWALAYTPDWALVDFNCNNSQSQVTRDIKLMAQLTRRIRLYGADCDQTAMVLEAIKVTKADIQVYPGIYVTDNNASYVSQRNAVLNAIQTYGTDHIAGVTVGNEFMLNYLTQRNQTEANSPIGNIGAKLLIDKINDTRTHLAGLNLNKAIPVGNSDAGYYFNTNVLKAVDYGLSNVHAWFANTSIDDAASWVFKYFDEENVVPAAQLPNKPTMYVSETGWPTASSNPATAQNGGGADASVANLQIFIDNFVCKANSEKLGYFFFEFIDEQWKEYRFGGVEGHWGLFDKNYNLKNITLPDCLTS